MGDEMDQHSFWSPKPDHDAMVYWLFSGFLNSDFNAQVLVKGCLQHVRVFGMWCREDFHSKEDTSGAFNWTDHEWTWYAHRQPERAADGYVVGQYFQKSPIKADTSLVRGSQTHIRTLAYRVFHQNLVPENAASITTATAHPIEVRRLIPSIIDTSKTFSFSPMSFSLGDSDEVIACSVGIFHCYKSKPRAPRFIWAGEVLIDGMWYLAIATIRIKRPTILRIYGL